MIPPETPDEKSLRSLRSEIRNRIFKPGEYIEFKCFNRVEANWISDGLTTGERKRVKFTWLEFGKFDAPGIHLGIA